MLASILSGEHQHPSVLERTRRGGIEPSELATGRDRALGEASLVELALRKTIPEPKIMKLTPDPARIMPPGLAIKQPLEPLRDREPFVPEDTVIADGEIVTLLVRSGVLL